MKRKMIITLLTVSMMCLSSCGKSDDIEPVMSSAIETDDQQEVEEENIVAEVEDIIEEEPEQEVEEVDTVEPEQLTQETEPDPEPVEEVAEQIDVDPLDKIMYAQSDVNTRIGDSTDYEKVGSLTTNQAVHVIGQSTSTGWYQIDIEGVVMFVSNKYLADTKMEVRQPEQSTTQSSSNIADGSTPPSLTAEQKAILDSLGGPSYFGDIPAGEGNLNGGRVTVDVGNITAQ